MSGLILCADLHEGLTTHDGPGLDGSPSWRQAEAEMVANFIYGESCSRKAPLIVAGDLYHGTRPQAWAYRAAGRLRPNIVIPGNHDWPVGDGVMSPLKVYPGSGMTAEVPEFIQDLGGQGIDIMLIPWFGRAYVAAAYPDLAVGEQNRAMAEALERIVADLANKKRDGVPLIVVTHFTIGGATWNSGVQPQVGESNDFMVPASIFADDRIAHVFAGHIHRPQTFGKVTYIGSPVRSDFGEEGQPTRILHVTADGDGVAVEEILTPSVEFRSFTIETGCTIVPPFSEGKGRVCRLVGEMPAGEQSAALIAQVTDGLFKHGALRVAKPAVKFVRHEARAVRSIATDATPADALRSYADMVGGDVAKHLDALLAVQATLLEGRTA